MEHIQTTLARKRLVDEAGDIDKAYHNYRAGVLAAQNSGMRKAAIIEELMDEMERIKLDQREGDPLFKVGVHNLKVACVAAINKIIEELKGEN